MDNLKNSILDMATGAIKERVDYDVTKVIDNILDLNTKAQAKRKIVLTIEFVPDEDRKKMRFPLPVRHLFAPQTRYPLPWLSFRTGTVKHSLWKWFRRFPGRWLWMEQNRPPRNF